jgi:hypothetical protein
MRELKNLDCSISPVKCQRRRAGGGGWVLGLKMFFPFPLKFISGVGLLGVFCFCWFCFGSFFVFMVGCFPWVVDC